MDAIRAMLDEDATLAALRRARDSDDPAIALRAVQLMLDRVLGKPKETVETVSTPHEVLELRELTDEQLAARLAELRAERDRGVTSTHEPSSQAV